MPVDAAGLASAIRQGRLLEPAQADELGRLQASFPEPRALAAELIRRGWLTPYQINQLMQGRGRDLFLGSYVLLERIGEGGMGAVFKARNWKLGRIVALKLIRKERLNNPDALRRFHREIRAAAQLDHPNIVRAFDADEVNGTHLLVMEYVQGTDLAKLVKAGGPLAVDKACDYVRQAALGLQHASERGMVHRDIKPHNLLLTPSGVVKILDMGLARLGGGEEGEGSSTMTREGTVMGTPDYIAPEQAIDSHDVDIRADLYSLGCTLYFLLTGKVPFPGGEALQKLLKHRLDEPVPVEQLRRSVPPGVAAVVRKMMAKQPEDRCQTPAEAAAALASALDYESRTGQEEASTSATQAITSAVEAPASATAGWSSVVADRGTDQTPAPRRRPRRPSPDRTWLWLGSAIGVTMLVLGLVGLFRFLPPGPKPPPDLPSAAPEAKRDKSEDAAAGAFDKVVEEVAALSPSKQTEWVAAKLKEYNPGFDGAVKPTIENGELTGLDFLTDDVTDLSPVRALTGLKVLTCSGSASKGGRLSDLSPLKGMKLTVLACYRTQVSDLSPLKDMKLTDLDIGGTPASDLSPLKGMKLTSLNIGNTPVSDLSPLKDMKLTDLNLYRCGNVTDLSPLKGMPLTNLHVEGSSVSDLSPLAGMAFTSLNLDDTRASNLSPLTGMKLTSLRLGNCVNVTDLSPLKGMPLKSLNLSGAGPRDLSALKDLPLQDLWCDFQFERDAAILRSIKTLETINGKPAADFWKR